MKKILALSIFFILISANAHATTLFARTAGGAWHTAGTWSTTSSAGASSGTTPAATDDVIFDSGSTGAVTLDSATLDVCKSVTMQSASNKLTFTSSDILIVSGSVTFFTGQGANVSGTGTLSMIVTGTLTTAGVTIPGGLSFGGTSQTYTLGDALAVTGTTTFSGTTLITLASAGNNLTLGAVSIATSTTFTGAGTLSGSSLAITAGPTSLTISSNWTMSGNFTTTGTTTIAGGSTLQVATWTMGTTVINSTALVVTGQITAGTATLSGTGSCQGGSMTVPTRTLTLNMDLTITGNVSYTGNLTLGGTNTLKIGGGLATGGFQTIGQGGAQGFMLFNGTGTWSGTSNISGGCALTINTAGTITVSSTVHFSGPFTFTAGTITGGTIDFNTNGSTLDTATGGAIASNISFNASSTYTLSSDFSTTGSITIQNFQPTFAGAHDITCATLNIGGPQTSKTITFVKSRTLTVTTAMNINSDNADGFTISIVSDTSSTATKLRYQGTLANQKVFGVIFTDVDASTSTNPIYNWDGGALTRTTNIYNVDPTSFPAVGDVRSGTGYAGGALTGTMSASSSNIYVTED